MTRIYVVTIAERIKLPEKKEKGIVIEPALDTWRTASHTVAVVDGWADSAISKAMELRNAAENADKIVERHALSVVLTGEAE